MPVDGDDIIWASNATHVGNFSIVPRDVTCNTGVVHDIATFNFRYTGVYYNNGEQKGGTSADTSATGGFTGGGIINSASATRNWTAGTVYNNSGTFSFHASMTTTTARGDFRQTAAAINCNTVNSNASFAKFTQDVGANVTLNGAVSLLRGGGVGVLNAQWNLGTNAFLCNASTLTINAGFFLSGSGNASIAGLTTFTNNCTQEHTYTGTLGLPTVSAGNNPFIPGLNMPGATFAYNRTSVSVTYSSKIIGNLTCLDFIGYAVPATYTHTVDNSVGNPNITILRTMTLGSATGTLTYTKGTGIITLGCSPTATATITATGYSLEAIVKSGTCEKLIAGDFTTVSLSGSDGAIRSSVAGTSRAITCTSVAPIPTGIAFKDINIVNASKYNAKYCTNEGNNTNMVFTDKITHSHSG